MAKIATAKLESAHMIYTDKGELIAIVKRDDISTKHLTYKVVEMNSADIAELMAGTVDIVVEPNLANEGRASFTSTLPAKVTTPSSGEKVIGILP